MAKLKGFKGVFKEEDIRKGLEELQSNMNDEIDFEGFLRVSLF